MAYDGSVYGNGTTSSTSGANTITHYYDRAGTKASTNSTIYANYVDAKSIPQKHGKTFKISKFRLILDSTNLNGQGLDGASTSIITTSVIYNNTAYADQTDADAARNADITTIWNASLKAEISALAATAKTTLVIVDNEEAFDTSTLADTSVEVAKDSLAVNTNIVNGTEGIHYTSLLDGMNDTFTVVGGGGNAYGGSRDVGDVSSGMPSLSEGSDRVNRVGVTKETIETTLQRYGNFIEYDDEVMLFSEDNVQMEYREKLGHMAGEVFDDATQLGMLGAAGLKLYAGTATTISELGKADAVNKVNETLVRKVAKQLSINKADKMTSILSGSVKVGTTPVNKAYYAIIGPDVKFDLEDSTLNPNFVPVYKYGNAKNVPKDEVGSMHETRFIETNRAMKYEGRGADVGTNPGMSETNGNYDVFPILYPTKGAYANVGLQGKGKITFKAKAPGVATTEDPYGVKGLFSYNFFYAGIALQPEKLAVAYVTASS